MQLTEEHKKSVRQWAAEGEGLSEIQNRLFESFGLRLSFMEVRLLVLDLQIDIREKNPPKPTPPPAGKPAAAPADGSDSDDSAIAPDEGDAIAGNVTVEVNRITQPGFMITGDVTFSDGVTAQWGVTSMGELSLAAPDNPGYRPTPEDTAEFQLKLREALQRQGMM